MNNSKSIWKNKLCHLPQYQAPKEIREQVFEQLDKLEWTEALNKLPGHKAPDEISLPFGKSKGTSFSRRRMNVWAGRAAILLLVSAFWFLWQHNRATDYQVERIPDMEMYTHFDSDEWLYMEEFCNQYQIACEDENIMQMEREWNEVVDAMFEIKQSLGRYGQDEFLLRELTHLENEHAALVNELLKKIWS